MILRTDCPQGFFDQSSTQGQWNLISDKEVHVAMNDHKTAKKAESIPKCGIIRSLVRLVTIHVISWSYRPIGKEEDGPGRH